MQLLKYPDCYVQGNGEGKGSGGMAKGIGGLIEAANRAIGSATVAARAHCKSRHIVNLASMCI